MAKSDSDSDSRSKSNSDSNSKPDPSSGSSSRPVREPIRDANPLPSISVDQIRKGHLLQVKSPPYYKKEYLYEVTSAGGKQVRASLFHSPKVRKSWTNEELELLLEMGIVRLARDDEKPSAKPESSSSNSN